MTARSDGNGDGGAAAAAAMQAPDEVLAEIGSRMDQLTALVQETRAVMVAPSRCALPPPVRYLPSAWEGEWRASFARAAADHADVRAVRRAFAGVASRVATDADVRGVLKDL